MDHINDELEFLQKMIKGIAKQFGKNCETVLLDLSNPEVYGSGRIVAIENSHVTGRSIGDTGTNLGLEVLRDSSKEGDKFNYLARSVSGRMLKCSTIFIRNNENVPIGSICINFDVTEFEMAESTIRTLTAEEEIDTKTKEVFVNNVNDVLDVLIQEAQDMMGKPVAFMTRKEKMKSIEYLDSKGAFLIKKAGDKICSYYDISKYTLYNYLDEARQENKKESILRRGEKNE
ncbi:transcriptional regulator [Salicibibacter cibarius]|uniref:Transcriptional regulator n=1 Tax=Salicibibacter cibarius TaxID=2743000 RepID=A0A7T6Z4N1_9BACI|nr:helix-turn-helix transcriptional regulator [Salicibibacter cibarius]QQK76662.1 transcriptional regulator [Salicibibacter cibarius]